MKARLLVVIALTFVSSIAGIAQTCSSTAYTNTLICTLPQLYSPVGLTLPNPNHAAHFADNSQSQVRPLNQSIGQTLSILPLGSSGSAITYTVDSEGHHIPSTDSLGPILTERANVIGRRAYSLGVAYQYFDFNRIDGIRLSSPLSLVNNTFPLVFVHAKSEVLDQTTDPTTLAGLVQSLSYKNDYIQTANQIRIELNQTVIYAVFGISNRIDASIEVPVQSAHLRAVSLAHIVRTQPCEGQQNPTDPSLGGGCIGPTLDPTGEAECGEFHYFQGYSDDQNGEHKNCTMAYANADVTFPNPGISFQMLNAKPNPVTIPARPQSSPMADAKGIGDITLRGKYEVIHHEKLTGSVGLGIRFPSGDANNFLGTGAYGLIPFGALTYRSRLSPHVRFGYEWNSSSILAGFPTGGINTTTNKPNPVSASLPPAFLYSGGADYRATKRLTIAADLIGERVRDASRVYLGSFNRLPQTDGTTPTASESLQSIPSIRSRFQSYSSDSIATGAKLRLFRELVLIGNITTRIDSGGLRADIVPLVGLSYAF